MSVSPTERWPKRLPKQVSELREYEITVIDGKLCRVTAVNKLGGNRWQVVGRDLFLWERVEAVMATEEMLFDPLLIRKEYILANISEDVYTLIDPETCCVHDVPKKPGFLCEKVKDLFLQDRGEVRVTVGRTPSDVGVVDYRLCVEVAA